jgi:uncharacterized iron-regulated membrane protein
MIVLLASVLPLLGLSLLMILLIEFALLCRIAIIRDFWAFHHEKRPDVLVIW